MGKENSAHEVANPLNDGLVPPLPPMNGALHTFVASSPAGKWPVGHSPASALLSEPTLRLAC
jgi:hypothetical protein